MSALVSLLVVLSTLAFGSVYPWAYAPLFVAAAGIGAAGLVRARGVPAERRRFALSVLFVALAIGAQLVPVSRSVLAWASPATVRFLSVYNLTFATTDTPHALSIDSAASGVALLTFSALGLYMVGLPSLLTARDLSRLPRNLTIFAVALSLIGIFGREHNNGLVYGFWLPEEGTNGNGFGPFVNRNHFAGWMLMATCLSIGILCGQMEAMAPSARASARQWIIWLSTSRASRIILAVTALVIMVVALVWTMSRSGIVGLIGAGGCCLWLLTGRPVGRGTGRAATPWMIAGILGAGLAWRGGARVAAWFGDPTDLISRTAVWQDSWRLVHDFPLAGTGMNTYGSAMVLYQTHVREFWMTHAHNDYLQLLAEGGLLVALPAALAVVCLALAVRRGLSLAGGHPKGYWIRAGAGVGLIAIAVQESVDFSLQIPANGFLFATLVAVAITPPTLH